MGMIGANNSANKFCTTRNCSVVKDEAQKYAYRTGLYIRVPKKVDPAFCVPSLHEDHFQPDLAAEFLTEKKTVSEWSIIFSQISAT